MLTITYKIDPNQASGFEDRQELETFTRKAAEAIIQRCQKEPNFGGNHMPPPIPPTHVFVLVGSEFSSERYEARLTISTGVIEVSHNGIPKAAAERKKAEDEARQVKARAAEKATAERNAKEKLRGDFTAKHGVTSFVEGSRLDANPFPYKDKVVGLRAWFSRMNSESEATFGIGNGDGIVVTGVNPAHFTRERIPTVLAIRVTGLRAIDAPFGKMSQATGALVGIYFCTTQQCGEFFDIR